MLTMIFLTRMCFFFQNKDNGCRKEHWCTLVMCLELNIVQATFMKLMLTHAVVYDAHVCVIIVLFSINYL